MPRRWWEPRIAFLLALGPGVGVAAPAAAAMLSPAASSAIQSALGRVPIAEARAFDVSRIGGGEVPCQPDGLPTDDRVFDERGKLHLCATSGADAEAGHAATGVALRAVTAILFASKQIAFWSELPAWRRLNRWSPSIRALGRDVAENRADDGFAAPVGRRSPRWDLAAFAAAQFLDETTGDERVACRFMSQAAFLRERLAESGGGDGHHPASQVPIAAPRPVCAGFESWAAADHLASFELVLAAPSTAMVGSLFGHVILRAVYRDDAGDTPPHLSRTIAFLADNERPLADDPGYALKGIFGFYGAALHERSFLETFREYVVDEGRDLQRWRIDLDPLETRALLERLWTALGRTRYTYYFFRRNCATLLLDLIDDARPPGAAVVRPGILAAPPSSTLEAWAAATGPAGRPLLAFVPEPITSFQSEARAASLSRRAREPRLLVALASARPDLAALLGNAHAPDATARTTAYQQLGPVLADAPSAIRGDVEGWLRSSATIESHLSAVANQEAAARADKERRLRLREVTARLAATLASEDRAAGLPTAVASLRSEKPEERLAGYQALRANVAKLPPRTASRARLFAVLTSELEYDVARMNTVPGLRDSLVFVDDKTLDEQPYMKGFEDLIRFPVETRVSPALLAVLAAEAAVRRAEEAGGGARGDGGMRDNEDDDLAPSNAARRADALARAYEARQSRSGIDQLAILAGVATPLDGDAAPSAGLVLAGALYDEELGGQRRFGFPSDTGFVVARSRAFISATEGTPRVERYEARVVGYRSLRATLPEADQGPRRGPGGFGWEAFLDTTGDHARAVANEVKLAWGVLAPLVERRDLADHLLATFGLAGRTRSSLAAGVDRTYAMGAPLGLEGRATIGTTSGHRSWLAARLWVEPALSTGSRSARTTLEAGAAAELHLAFRARAESGRHDPALLVRVDALRAAPATEGDRVPGTTAFISAGIELR